MRMRAIIVSFLFLGSVSIGIRNLNGGGPKNKPEDAMVTQTNIPVGNKNVDKTKDTTLWTPIAAYVNEDIIMKREVLGVMQERQLPYGDALNFLIEQQLLLQDFNRKKGRISNAQVDIQMENILQNNFQGNRQAMRQVLQSHGQSFYGLKEDLRQSIIVHVMRQRNVISPFAISPKQVEAYYQSHKQDFQVESRYLIQQSGFSEKSTLTLADGKTLPKVERLKQLVQDKVDFETIKQQLDEFSMDPIWYGFSELQPALRLELLTLSLGGHTPYLQFNAVYMTSKLLNVEASKVKPLSEVQSEIEAQLLVDANNALYNQYIQYLRQQASIRVLESDPKLSALIK